MERYDIAIIGTGPAGLSAAITGKIRNKSILLFGKKDLSDKVQKAHQIDNYLGIPAVSGEELVQAFQTHLDKMEIPIIEKKVTAVYSMGEYFAIQTTDGNYESKTLIVATGVNFGKSLAGEDMYLGRGVSYCATCDAMLYRGKEVIVIGYEKSAEEEADFLAEVVGKVTYIPMYKEEVEVKDTIHVLKETPVEIVGTLKANAVKTETGTYQADGIFILRESIAPAALIPGLTMDGNHIAVNVSMETNLSGCFACGDIAGTPYQYIKAAGQGNSAVLSAVSYINKQK